MVNESKKKLEFKVIFNHINNLKNEEKGEKSLGSLELEGDSYAISISGNSKELSEIAPMLFSSFIEHYYTGKKQGKTVKKWSYDYEKGLEDLNLN